MDAHSIVAVGALNTAAEASQAAARRQLMLDSERRSMDAEDLRARKDRLVTQVFTHPAMAQRTWESAYAARHNDWVDAHLAMRRARDFLLAGDSRAAYDILGDKLGEEDEEDDDEEDAMVYVICRSSRGDGRDFYLIRAEGRWAGLAPVALIVCSSCDRDDMGEVESFF